MENLLSGTENDRRNMFMDLVRKEIPEALIDQSPDAPWRIRVEIADPDILGIVLEPSDPVMTDTKIDCENIFSEGIKMTKKILSDPPLKDLIFQGTLLIQSDALIFFQRKAGHA